MIQRIAKDKLKDLASNFKVVAVICVRQTGKTTLVKQVFKAKPYLSLENPDTRNFALEDPRGFLESYSDGAILDEVQRAPVFVFLLTRDLRYFENERIIYSFWLKFFLLQETISQTLAGRVGYMYLLPFSIAELKKAKLLLIDDDSLMLKGFYPPIYDQKIPAADWSPNCIRTYIEKDVRQIKNITNIIVFERFMKLLAGRSGQELNNSALAAETGVDVKTIQSWIGILESSFIIISPEASS